MEYVKLNNGVEMPILGYGVYQIAPEECARRVLEALEIGYRLIDTAQAYGNEDGVGEAVSTSGIPREEIFLTTKVWISNAGREKAARSIDESLARLRTDYVDLLLIHQPFGDCYGTYRAMCDALRAGKVRAVGVSNFYADRFVDLSEFQDVKPAVNQMETHVFNQQRELQEIMARTGSRLMSWGPFAEGRNGFFSNATLRKIAERRGKSVAQIALRSLVERGIVVIPKSVRRERMRENFEIFDFALTEEDKAEIVALDTRESLFFSHRDPEIVRWLAHL
ncbi:MAG: aldo/keto reductase [Candidatus Spyradosoma sp.]